MAGETPYASFPQTPLNKLTPFTPGAFVLWRTRPPQDNQGREDSSKNRNDPTVAICAALLGPVLCLLPTVQASAPTFCSKKPTVRAQPVLPKGPASPLSRSWLCTSAPAALGTLFLNHTPPSPSSSALFLCSVFSQPWPCPIPAHMLTHSACGPY